MQEIPIFSYKNAFLEGETKLHFGFYCGRLFVISRKLLDTNLPHLRIPNSVIKSLHKRLDDGFGYIIEAPNQEASVFNGEISGSLELSDEEYASLIKLGADSNFFISSFTKTFSMKFELIKGGVAITTDAKGIKLMFGSDLKAEQITAIRKTFSLPSTVAGDASFETAWKTIQDWVTAHKEGKQLSANQKAFLLGGKVGDKEVVGFFPATAAFMQNYAATRGKALLPMLPGLTVVCPEETEAIGMITAQATIDKAGVAFINQLHNATPEDIAAICKTLGVDNIEPEKADAAEVAKALEAAKENPTSAGGGKPAEEVIAEDVSAEDATNETPETPAETPIDAPSTEKAVAPVTASNLPANSEVFQFAGAVLQTARTSNDLAAAAVKAQAETLNMMEQFLAMIQVQGNTVEAPAAEEEAAIVVDEALTA